MPSTDGGSPTSLTVGFLPWWPQNPYQVLLKRELNERGIRVIGNPQLSLLRLMVGRDGLDVIHVHWPHGTYKTWPQMAFMVFMLSMYRLLKNNVVWTVHELEAYETTNPRRDDWLRRFVMRMSRRLIVHGEATKRELLHTHGYRRAIDLALHPSYIGWYRDEVSKEGARKQLNLRPDARVFLYFGYIKPYKGVEDLLRAFRALDDPSAILLVVGRPLDVGIEREVSKLAAADSRVRTVLGYVPDDSVELYFRAADAVVLPFRRTQTSGSLMLALSFGRPVVAPAIATLPEYVDSGCAIFFEPGDPRGLHDALVKASQMDLEGMGKAARAKAESLSWATMADVHAAAYQVVVGAVSDA